VIESVSNEDGVEVDLVLDICAGATVLLYLHASLLSTHCLKNVLNPFQHSTGRFRLRLHLIDLVV
jgi:hypothetical protein